MVLFGRSMGPWWRRKRKNFSSRSEVTPRNSHDGWRMYFLEHHIHCFLNGSYSHSLPMCFSRLVRHPVTPCSPSQIVQCRSAVHCHLIGLTLPSFSSRDSIQEALLILDCTVRFLLSGRDDTGAVLLNRFFNQLTSFPAPVPRRHRCSTANDLD